MKGWTVILTLAAAMVSGIWSMAGDTKSPLRIPEYEPVGWARFNQPQPPASYVGPLKYRKGMGTKEFMEYGNMVQLSWYTCDEFLHFHFLPDYIRGEARKTFDKMVERNRARVKAIADKTHARGGTVYIHSYEVGGKPRPKFVAKYINPELDKEHVYGEYDKRIAFLENRVYELFREMPYLDGFAITTGEGRSPNRTPQEFKDYIMACYRGMRRAESDDGRADRYILVRNWIKGCLPGREHLYFPVSDDPEVNKRILVRTKLEADDVAPWGGLNSMISRQTGHSLLVEQAMMYQEYGGFNWYPFDMVTKMRNLYIRALAAGVEGVTFSNSAKPWNPSPLPKFFGGRRGWGSGYDMVWSRWADYNSSVWFGIVKNPAEDIEVIKRRWAVDKFGENGGVVVLAILERSYEAMIRIMTVGGGYFNSHSTFGNSIRGKQLPSHILSNLDGILQRPYNVPGLREIDLSVSKANTERLIKWKHRGVELVEEMLDIVKMNQALLDENLRNWLLTNLASMRAYGLAREYYSGVCLWFKYWERTRVPEQKAYAKERILKTTEKLERLVKEGPEFLGRRGPKSPVVIVREIRKLVNGEVESEKLWLDKPPAVSLPRALATAPDDLPNGSLVIEVESLGYWQNASSFQNKKASGGRAVRLNGSLSACGGAVKIPAGSYFLRVHGYGETNAKDAAYVKLGEQHKHRVWFHQWETWRYNGILKFDKDETLDIQVLNGEPGVVVDKIVLEKTADGKGIVKSRSESSL